MNTVLSHLPNLFTPTPTLALCYIIDKIHSPQSAETIINAYRALLLSVGANIGGGYAVNKIYKNNIKLCKIT